MEQQELNCRIGECYLWWSSPYFFSEFFFPQGICSLFSHQYPVSPKSYFLIFHTDSCYLVLSFSLTLINLSPTSHKGKGLDKIKP